MQIVRTKTERLDPVKDLKPKKEEEEKSWKRKIV